MPRITRARPKRPESAAIASGRAALARGAWDEARQRFSEALADDESAEALEGLGWALWWLDVIDASFAARERAFLLYSRAGARRDAARVAIHLAVDGADLREPAVTSGWLERAARLLDRLPAGVEHAWLALWRGHVDLFFGNDPAAARRGAESAGALGRRLHVPDLELLARALEGLALVREGRVRDGMRRLDEATTAALAGEISDLDSVTTTCCFMVYACEHVRDYDRATQWQRRVEEFSTRWRLRDVFAGCRIKHAQLLEWQGRWPEAEALLVELLRSLERARPPVAREAAAALARLRLRQGRLREAEELLAHAEGLSGASLVAAELALLCDDPRAALEHLDRAARRAARDNLAVRSAVHELSLRARLALRELDGAAASLASLEEIAAAGGTPPLEAAARLGRGRLALARSRPEEAVPALEDAVDLFVRSRAAYDTAMARLDLAAALERAGRRERAREERARADAALRGLGAPVPGSGGRDHGTGARPTRREREVLALVARGLPDREIARRLDLSPHTVHRHVANVLAKLECTSRAAAVAAAARLGYL